MKKSTANESLNEIPEFFGHYLPNGSTMGLALDNPIVISSSNNIDAEVKVIQSFLSHSETVAWDVLSQRIENVGEKKIDCYEIMVSDWEDSTKEGFTVKFYFDVSDCLK